MFLYLFLTQFSSKPLRPITFPVPGYKGALPGVTCGGAGGPCSEGFRWRREPTRVPWVGSDITGPTGFADGLLTHPSKPCRHKREEAGSVLGPAPEQPERKEEPPCAQAPRSQPAGKTDQDIECHFKRGVLPGGPVGAITGRS